MLNIVSEFIPRVLFITCIFIYMDALIVFKWIYFNATNSDQAPSVLLTLIDMVLFKYEAPPETVNSTTGHPHLLPPAEASMVFVYVNVGISLQMKLLKGEFDLSF